MLHPPDKLRPLEPSFPQIQGDRFPRAPETHENFRRIRRLVHLGRMSQAQSRTSGLVTPSADQHWLVAMLCAFAELVFNAVRRMRMVRVRLSDECHIDVTHPNLPASGHGPSQEETSSAAASGEDLSIHAFDPGGILRCHPGRRRAAPERRDPFSSAIDPEKWVADSAPLECRYDLAEGGGLRECATEMLSIR